MNYIKCSCNCNFDRNISEFFEEEATRYYVCDLNHKAPLLVQKAKEAGISIYGAAGRRGKGQWMAICSNGKKSPKTYWVKLSNGSIFLDYSSFDTNKSEVAPEEMELIVAQLHNFVSPDKGWTTSNNLIKTKLCPFLEAQCELSDVEKQHYDYLEVALRGGANHVIKLRQTLPVETHVDFHQIYGYVMAHNNFPCGEPVEVEGYYDHPFAIYMIEPGCMARVKKDGFPIIPIGQDFVGMAGTDGEWFDVGLILQYLSKPDLDLLMENYEFQDNIIRVAATFYYPNSFSGSEYFAPVVQEIYEKRKLYKGQPEERFFKILNEVLPGHFERRGYYGGFWVKDFKPNEKQGAKYYNPKVGIFITAYARKELNRILHMFPKHTVIGYDTDCVFFSGRPNQIPAAVRALFGPEPGQLHEDGYYEKVYHRASKSYYGLDAATQEPFKKIAGLSKSGKAWKWNVELQQYELKEVNADEARQLTL